MKAPPAVCPNCAEMLPKPTRLRRRIKTCPNCGFELPPNQQEAVVDKEVADSFPASDPPPY